MKTQKPDERGKYNLHLSLDEEDYNTLWELAKREVRTMSGLIRYWIRREKPKLKQRGGEDRSSYSDSKTR